MLPITNNPQVCTDLVLSFRWYQTPPDISDVTKLGKTVHQWMVGPLGHWSGELHAELINTPRLIAERLLIPMPPKPPTQGTYDSVRDVMGELTPLMRARIQLVDTDLEAYRLAEGFIAPIADDIKSRDPTIKPTQPLQLDSLVPFLRRLIIARNVGALCDTEDGVAAMADTLIRIDRTALSDRSRERLKILEGLLANYYRTPHGPMTILKPIGPEQGASNVFQTLISQIEEEHLIRERNMLGQIAGLSKLKAKQILDSISAWMGRNKSVVKGAVATTALKPGMKPLAEGAVAALTAAGIRGRDVPLVNLSNSRVLALIEELQSIDPVFTFAEGRMGLRLHMNLYNPNFGVLLSNTLSLREEAHIRTMNLEKKGGSIELSLDGEKF